MNPALLAALLGAVLSGPTAAQDQTLRHPGLQRELPVWIQAPVADHPCLAMRRCRVALLAAGWGLQPHAYGFLADALRAEGHAVVGVGLQLPQDAAPASIAQHQPLWQRGAQSLRFVLQTLAPRHPEWDWRQPLLIGHSHGGDVMAWWVREDGAAAASALIILDHRHVPLPRSGRPRVLSLRTGDAPADPGVLPSAAEQAQHHQCVLNLSGARHHELHDGGPPALKAQVAAALRHFLSRSDCPPHSPQLAP